MENENDYLPKEDANNFWLLMEIMESCFYLEWFPYPLSVRYDCQITLGLR